MKNIATVVSASVLAVASVSVSASGQGPDNGYGYGYAPYGYGVPVQPPVQLTEDQIKAMQEQQAKAFEYMQNVQRQMAQYYANNPDPIVSMERSMFEERNAHMQEMNKLIVLPEDVAARQQEMEKQAQDYRKAAEERRAAFMKAAEQRRLDAEKRFESRKLQRNSRTAPVVDAPKADSSSEDAKKS